MTEADNETDSYGPILMNRLLSKLTSLSVISALLITSPGISPYQVFAEALRPVPKVNVGGLKTPQFFSPAPEIVPLLPDLRLKLDLKLEAVQKAAQEYGNTERPSESETADFREKTFKELINDEKNEAEPGISAEPQAGVASPVQGNNLAPPPPTIPVGHRFGGSPSVSDTQLSGKNTVPDTVFFGKVSPFSLVQPPLKTSSFIRAALFAGLGIALSALTQDWTPAGVSLAMAPFGAIVGFHPEEPFREKARQIREKIGAFLVANFEAGKEVSPSKLESLEKELVLQGVALHEIGTEQRFLLETPLASGLVRIQGKIYLTTKKTEMDPSYWGKKEAAQFNGEWARHRDVISSEFSKIYSLSKALATLREDNLQAYDYDQAGKELEKAVLELESIQQNKIISSLPASNKFVQGLKEMAVSTLQILKENKLHPPQSRLERFFSFIKSHPWTSLSTLLNFGAGYLLGGMHAFALGAGLANLAVAVVISSGISAASSSSKAKNTSRFFLYTAIASFIGSILGVLFPSSLSAGMVSFLEFFKSISPILLTAGPSSHEVQLAGFGMADPHVYGIALAAIMAVAVFQAGRLSIKSGRPQTPEPPPTPWVQAVQTLQKHRGFLIESRPLPPLETTVQSWFSRQSQKSYKQQFIEEIEITENPDYDFLKTVRISTEKTYSNGFRLRPLETEDYHFDLGTGRPYLRHIRKFDLKGNLVEEKVIALSLGASEEELKPASAVREKWVQKILLLKSQEEELKKTMLPWWKTLFSIAAFAALTSLQSPEAGFAMAMTGFALPGPLPQNHNSKGLLPWEEVMSKAVEGGKLELKGEKFTEHTSYLNSANGLMLLIYRLDHPPQGPIRENVYYINREGVIEQIESSTHDPNNPEGPYLGNNIYTKDSIPHDLAASGEELKQKWIERVSLIVHAKRVFINYRFGQEVNWEGYKTPVLQMGYSQERIEELEHLLKFQGVFARIQDRFYYTALSVPINVKIRAEQSIVEAHPELANSISESIEYFKKSITDYLFKEGWKKPLSSPVQEAPKHFEELWAKFLTLGLKEYAKILRTLSETSGTFLQLGLRQAMENYLSELYQPAQEIDFQALQKHFTDWRYSGEQIQEAKNLLIQEKVLTQIGEKLYFLGKGLDPNRLGLSWKQEAVWTNVAEASGLLDLFTRSPVSEKGRYLKSLLSWTTEKRQEVSQSPQAAGYFDRLSHLAQTFLKLGILADVPEEPGSSGTNAQAPRKG